jgi:hypothetical protein
MEIPPGEVMALHTITFVPPLGPGHHRIHARINPHIPAAPAFQDEARRKNIVDETWGTLGKRLESGPITAIIQKEIKKRL